MKRRRIKLSLTLFNQMENNPAVECWTEVFEEDFQNYLKDYDNVSAMINDLTTELIAYLKFVIAGRRL